MRIFANVEEANNEVRRDLYEMGTKVGMESMQNKIGDFETKEIQGYAFTILDTSDADKMVDNLDWCESEFIERVSPNVINPGVAWEKRPEVWSQFLVNGEFCYTYNERIRTQLDYIIQELQEHPTSRQAIIEIHNNILDIKSLGGKKRIPCSMYYQFLYRDGQLDVIYNMRSCDYHTHFRNDIWQACELRDYIAKMCNMKSGKFIMFIGSLHAYREDFGKGEVF